MDNDDYRRGRLTNHKVFGEANAVLAGDALLTAAFETASGADAEPAVVVKIIRILSEAAGENGMVGGQVLDLAGEKLRLGADNIHTIHELKTGALISAACRMGAAAAGANARQMEAARAYAAALGLAFQLRDDMLDVIGDEKTFGKPIGSDREEGKTTFVDILGLNGCQRVIEAHSESAVEALGDMEDTDFLIHLVRVLEKRKQ